MPGLPWLRNESTKGAEFAEKWEAWGQAKEMSANDHLGTPPFKESPRCDYWVMCDGEPKRCMYQPHGGGEHLDLWSHTHKPEEWHAIA